MAPRTLHPYVYPLFVFHFFYIYPRLYTPHFSSSIIVTFIGFISWSLSLAFFSVVADICCWWVRGQVLKTAAEIASKGVTQDNQHFFILLILTDGAVNGKR